MIPATELVFLFFLINNQYNVKNCRVDKDEVLFPSVVD